MRPWRLSTYSTSKAAAPTPTPHSVPNPGRGKCWRSLPQSFFKVLPTHPTARGRDFHANVSITTTTSSSSSTTQLPLDTCQIHVHPSPAPAKKATIPRALGLHQSKRLLSHFRTAVPGLPTLTAKRLRLTPDVGRPRLRLYTLALWEWASKLNSREPSDLSVHVAIRPFAISSQSAVLAQLAWPQKEADCRVFKDNEQCPRTTGFPGL